MTTADRQPRAVAASDIVAVAMTTDPSAARDNPIEWARRDVCAASDNHCRHEARNPKQPKIEYRRTP